MDETLIIEGERFLGKFKAIKQTSEFWGGSEYTTHTYTGFWYEGTGLIKDRETAKTYFFALRTPRFREGHENDYTLEESIVHFNQRGPVYAGDFEPKVVNGMYKNIVDLSLGNMISQAETSEEDIPTITPKRLKLDDLVERGYCVGRDGQIQLAFSK